MADNLAQVQKDVQFWQRLLTFAGYKPGKIDGVNGRKTCESQQGKRGRGGLGDKVLIDLPTHQFQSTQIL